MNTNIDNTPADDTRFDRLVDGQLSEQQRHDLLAGLDDEPDGWRRCALAFLESQCWKQTFGAITQESLPPAEPAVATPPSRSAWPGRLGTVLAMAASFALAMWIGWSIQQTRDGKIARNVDRQPPLSTDFPSGDSSAKPWRIVNVFAPGRDGKPGPSISLPAIERDRIDKQWLQSIPPAIPQNVREALARTGHQIKQRRELVPVPLKDGRQLVMPVDQIDVHYVGNGPY